VAVPVALPGDAALPAADEVPAFLLGKPAAPPQLPTEVALRDDAAIDLDPAHEPTLRELMRGVRVEDGSADEGFAVVQGAREAEVPEAAPASLDELMRGVRLGDAGDDGESWAFIGGADDPEPEAAVVAAAPAEPVEQAPAVEAVAVAVAEPEDPPAEAEADRCAPLRRLLDKRNAFVRRAAAERDTFGYVENEEDQQALRLLQGLRRCAEHPDDPDCRPKPVEVDINDVVIPSHQIERDPSDLNAEGRLPDEIAHDPEVLDLLHRLKACEREQVVQPLLQRGRP
jgi:hypothetical protein